VTFTPACLSTAKDGCAHCGGIGRTPNLEDYCRCVYRGIFRRVVWRYHNTHSSQRSLHSQGFLCEEFRADVENIGRRTVQGTSQVVWTRFFLGGSSWAALQRTLALDYSNTRNFVYLLEPKLGRAFLAAGLFPLEDYFSVFPKRIPIRKADGVWRCPRAQN